MKTTLKANYVVAMAFMVIGLFLVAPPFHNGLAYDNKDDCTVKDDTGYDEKDSLARFVYWFNKDDYYRQFCKKSIKFNSEVANISLRQSVSLTGSNESGGEFVLGTDDANSKVVFTINNSTTKFSDHGELGKCVVYIATPSVRLKNLTITGDANAADVSGICIDANQVTFENVTVTNFTGDAIRLGRRATQISFTGDLNVLAFSESGIRVIGEDWSISKALNLPFGGVSATALDLIQNREYNIYLPNKAFIVPELLTMNEDVENPGVWTIWGMVYNCEAQKQDDKVVCPDGTEAESVQVDRVYIYKQEEGNSVEDFGNKFGKESLSTFVEPPVNVGREGTVGLFTFQYDKNAQKTSKIFLVPLIEAGNYGSATKVFGVTRQEGILSVGGLGEGGGGGEGVSGGGASLKQALTECSLNLKNVDPFKDTDMDGIKDGVETSHTRNGVNEREKGTCDCNKTVSCWYKYDTDGDGISDSAEWGQADDPVDTDNDGIANVLDTDSDNDNLADYQEDRSRLYNSSWPSFYFYAGLYYGAMNNQPFSGQDGKPLRCALGDKNSVGARYGWYLVSADGQVSQYNLDPNASGRIEHLVCLSSTLDIAKDFNGTYDSNRGETNRVAADTDIDGVCDGDGGGCAGLVINDRCPERPVQGIADCSPGCIENEVLMSISSDYLEADADGIPVLKLKDEKDKDGNSGKNGIYDLYDYYQMKNWTEIMALCSNKDTDSDGIPDCLERDSGQCQPSANNRSLQLDPYNADTDSDGKMDNIDDDPFGIGGDLYKLFLFRPVLACYVDRDGDGLRDCEEDINLDSIIVQDGTESDPLKFDSDDDGLSDKDELRANKPTNPFTSDTDSDGLSDVQEMGTDGVYTPAVAMAGGVAMSRNVGCSAAVNQDDYAKIFGETDPTNPDTDGDGLLDGEEIIRNVDGNKMKTNPNNPDSDGDGLMDAAEDTNHNGKWPEFVRDGGGQLMADLAVGEAVTADYMDTNPCSADTDSDGINDKQEKDNGTCASNPATGCKINDNYMKYGPDSDADGMPDLVEKDPKWGTDETNPDTDGDGLIDGCDSTGELGELCWHVSTGNWNTDINTAEGESNPGKKDDISCTNSGRSGVTLLDAEVIKDRTAGGSLCRVQIAVACGSDSDGDGLPDYYEKQFGTKPNDADSDGDGIIDGIEAGWIVVDETGGPGSGEFTLRKQKGRESYVAGGMTNPADADTDKDGLVDGYSSATSFEDKNCNGRVDVDARGFPKETDSRNGDTNGNGKLDGQEARRNGIFDPNFAATPRRQGCSNISGAEGETWGMTMMLLTMLIATRVAANAMRRTKKIKTRR